MLVVCDIDGTLADLSKRMKKAGKMPSRHSRRAFQKWLDTLQSNKTLAKDQPIVGMLELIGSLRGQMSPITLVYLTGRSERYRKVTAEWLEKQALPQGPLIMRGENDWRSAKDYKASMMQILAENHPGHNVIVFDDDFDGDCSAMYRKNGWLHLKVLAPEPKKTRKAEAA